jgi:beta-glucosidase
MIKFILFSVFVVQSVFAAHPWEPEARNDNWWKEKHEAFLTETKKDAQTIKIIFYGDSITEGWKGSGQEVWKEYYSTRNAVNYGIGGDLTQHLIWRINNGEVEGLHPKLVILKIGTNNLGSANDEDIAKGVKQVIEDLQKKLPSAKVLLLGILPRGDANNAYEPRIKHINSIIKTYADGNKVKFLDMGPSFEDASGHIHENLYVPDKLHLSKEGYSVWAKTMDELFRKMAEID